MSPITENRKQSMLKYARENLKRVPLDIQKDEYERIQEHANARGEKINGFIKRAIRAQIERDNSPMINITLNDLTAIKAILESINIGSDRESRIIADVCQRIELLWDEYTQPGSV